MRTVWMAALACVLAVQGCKKGGDSGGGGGEDEPVEVDNTPVVHSEISKKPPQGCGGPFWSTHYERAYKTLREAEEFKAHEREYYVSEMNDNRNEYFLAGISKTERADWFSSHKTAEKDQHCMNGVFDAIGEQAKKNLSKYKPRGYNFDDSGEVKLIKAAVKEEIPDAEFLKVGTKSETWKIEKLGNGNPKSRYKYGMAWIKSPKFDDGYCRIAWVNIVQDYSGGGTYNDSEANYLSVEPAGCK
jgi:hypothetical protein